MLDRRQLFAAAAGAALVSTSRSTRAGEPHRSAARSIAPGGHPVVPLSFDPKRLRGLSEKLLVSHHDRNYAGAVKNLNKVELDLARTTKDTPPYAIAGLRERELTFTNSMILHELYFDNLGGDGKRAGAIDQALGAAFGSAGRFEEAFRATAMSLGGGSGWAILGFNFQTADLGVSWAGGHSQSVAFGAPLLVLDMYEHAYAIDHGAAHARYVDAFFANLRWEVVERRLTRARAAARALSG
jgi:Fe-Mn family superoxide dismutase